MEKNSMLVNVAAAELFNWEGFDMAYMFPAGTNLSELVRNDTGTGSTRRILGFHIRRAALQATHSLITYYSRFPPMPISVVGGLAHRLFGVPRSYEHYPARVAQLSELESLGTNGPSHVAVSLEFLPMPSPANPVQPTTVKLASGDIIKPTQAELNEYAREMERLAEMRQAHEQDAVRELVQQAGKIILWASLSRSVNRVTIYERNGALYKYAKRLRDEAQRLLDEVPESLSRVVSVRFGHHPAPASDAEELDIVLLGDRLKEGGKQAPFPAETQHTSSSPVPVAPESADGLAQASALTGARNYDLTALIGSASPPDLFIAFSRTSGGFPISALQSALIFTPRRRELLTNMRPQLLEWVAALKFYQFERTTDLAQQDAQRELNSGPGASGRLISREASRLQQFEPTSAWLEHSSKPWGLLSLTPPLADGTHARRSN